MTIMFNIEAEHAIIHETDQLEEAVRFYISKTKSGQRNPEIYAKAVILWSMFGVGKEDKHIINIISGEKVIE